MNLQRYEFFTWADRACWGARLAGGLNYAIDFVNKKFILTSSYSPDTNKDFPDEGFLTDREEKIFEGFNRIFEVFVKEYKISEDYKFYLYQKGTSFYYEGDSKIPRE